MPNRRNNNNNLYPNPIIHSLLVTIITRIIFLLLSAYVNGGVPRPIDRGLFGRRRRTATPEETEEELNQQKKNNNNNLDEEVDSGL